MNIFHLGAAHILSGSDERQRKAGRQLRKARNAKCNVKVLIDLVLHGTQQH